VKEQLTNTFIRDRYDSILDSKYQGYYEHYHWLDTYAKWIQYRSTFEVVWAIAQNVEFEHMLEVGPGPGTWTKCFLYKHPEAKYTLVDISKELLRQNELNIGDREGLRRVVSSLEDFDSGERRYDLFFSSRVIEYAEDKDQFVKAAVKAMKSEARGFIITKMPKKDGQKRIQHTAQMHPFELKKLLEKHGCEVVRHEPVAIRARGARKFPIVNRIVWKYVRGKDILNLPQWIEKTIESYMIEFRKV
jgi:trans-aconitate methyltransferase